MWIINFRFIFEKLTVEICQNISIERLSIYEIINSLRFDFVHFIKLTKLVLFKGTPIWHHFTKWFKIWYLCTRCFRHLLYIFYSNWCCHSCFISRIFQMALVLFDTNNYTVEKGFIGVTHTSNHLGFWCFYRAISPFQYSVNDVKLLQCCHQMSEIFL